MAMVSATALWLATDQTRPEMARLVFASILPLLGTWVGTVLAFYFARENMSAATENTARLLGLQSSTPVTAIMVPKARMITHNLAAGAVVLTVQLVDLYKRMLAAGIARIPILDASGTVLYTVHKAMLTAFAASFAPPKDPAALTEQMHHLLADPDRKRLVEAMGFVGPSALIEDARNRMRSIPDCNDVFVTSSGKKTDPVIGWLTNTDLAGAE
jgi:uncharacterized SAM-binding protein YcdF (DUF218 family)